MTTDEETPLLRHADENGTHDDDEPKETPIPWGQFSLTLVLQLAEPMSSQVCFLVYLRFLFLISNFIVLLLGNLSLLPRVGTSLAGLSASCSSSLETTSSVEIDT